MSTLRILNKRQKTTQGSLNGFRPVRRGSTTSYYSVSVSFFPRFILDWIEKKPYGWRVIQYLNQMEQHGRPTARSFRFSPPPCAVVLLRATDEANFTAKKKKKTRQDKIKKKKGGRKKERKEKNSEKKGGKKALDGSMIAICLNDNDFPCPFSLIPRILLGVSLWRKKFSKIKLYSIIKHWMNWQFSCILITIFRLYFVIIIKQVWQVVIFSGPSSLKQSNFERIILSTSWEGSKWLN